MLFWIDSRTVLVVARREGGSGGCRCFGLMWATTGEDHQEGGNGEGGGARAVQVLVYVLVWL